MCSVRCTSCVDTDMFGVHIARFTLRGVRMPTTSWPIVMRAGGLGVKTHWAAADAGPVEIASVVGTVRTAAATRRMSQAARLVADMAASEAPSDEAVGENLVM